MRKPGAPPAWPAGGRAETCLPGPHPEPPHHARHPPCSRRALCPPGPRQTWAWESGRAKKPQGLLVGRMTVADGPFWKFCLGLPQATHRCCPEPPASRVGKMSTRVRTGGRQRSEARGGTGRPREAGAPQKGSSRQAGGLREPGAGISLTLWFSTKHLGYQRLPLPFKFLSLPREDTE